MIGARNYLSGQAFTHIQWLPQVVMSTKCPVYIVDEDRQVRKHLVRLLREQAFDPIPFSSSRDFLEALGFLAAGIAVLELRLADMNGMIVQEELLSLRPDIPIIMMTASADIPTAVHVIKKGAVDFLEKPFADSQILKVLTNVQPLLKDRIESKKRKDSAMGQLYSLTKRERDIIWALGTHRSSRAVAEELHLSTRTIEMHRASIMKKFGAKRFSDIPHILFDAGIDDKLQEIYKK